MRPYIPLFLLVLGFILAAIFAPNFMSVSYLLDSSTIYVETGLLAIGVTFVIVSGNIDLSIASNLVLTACLTAKFLEARPSIPQAAVFACGVGSLLGLINGLLVAKLRLPSFLVTLGTMATYRGAAQAMLGPASVKLPTGFKGLDQSTVFGVPWPLIIFLALALVGGFILHRTVFGRWVFALGTNESAARYSALPADGVKIGVFALTGFLCGVGALLIDSRLAVARHSLASGMELDAITVAVVGGAAISGGRGSMFGTTCALFLIALIKVAMGVANVKPEYQLTAIGALLILAVMVMNLDLTRLRHSAAKL